MSGSTFHLQGDEGEVHQLLGVTHRILVGGAESDGAAAVVEVTVSPGAGSPPHIDRREALVWYVIDGAIDFETETGPVKLGAGGAIFLERDARHGFANSGGHPARALLLALPAGIEGFFRDAASVLPAEAPTGPPPAEVANALGDVAGRYGIELVSKDANGVAVATPAK
jgi:quercetin dioxygenase-like cupin family protein